MTDVQGQFVPTDDSMDVGVSRAGEGKGKEQVEGGRGKGGGRSGGGREYVTELCSFLPTLASSQESLLSIGWPRHWPT